MKCIRRILGVPPTHIDRMWTNEIVWNIAKHEVGKKFKLIKFSQMWGSLKMSLLGHVLRAKGNDPLRQVTLEGLADYPRIIPKYRVGRPRLD